MGNPRSGKRAKWKKSAYMEQDLLGLFEKTKSLARFKARFIFSPQQLRWFWGTIKHNAIKPKETEHHAQNRLLLFCDKVHNSLSGAQMADKYEIGIATAFSHVWDLLLAILKSYDQSEVVSFPNSEERELMEAILKQKGEKMPHAIFAVDGSHLRCMGRNNAERRSKKYNWLPCFGVHIICDRIFGSVVAFNIDKAASKHDLTALRDSWFYNTLDEIMGDWLVLADKECVSLSSSLLLYTH